jgi:hypothetical protein
VMKQKMCICERVLLFVRACVRSACERLVARVCRRGHAIVRVLVFLKRRGELTS